MKIETENIRNKASEITCMENCIAYDLGLDYDKKAKLIENNCRENWKSFVCFGHTNDGLQVEGLEAKGDLNHPDFCIVYVSFGKVISDLEVIDTNNSTELWDAINRALYHFFFNK